MNYKYHNFKHNILVFWLLSFYIFAHCNSSHNNNSDTTNLIVETNTIAKNTDSLLIKSRELIEISSLDGLTITADWYFLDSNATTIVLCHQAKFNKYEYREAASKFMQLGFNCLAIDQRSGGTMVDKPNLTHNRAVAMGIPVSYLDAEQDIIAAVEYIYDTFGKPVILLGSSYSASFALKIGNEDNRVKAIIAFSPGEYFRGKLDLKEHIKGLNKPTFVSSAKEEAHDIKILLKNLTSPLIQQYVPVSDGLHGSKVLWGTYENNTEYWDTLIPFLKSVK